MDFFSFGNSPRNGIMCNYFMQWESTINCLNELRKVFLNENPYLFCFFIAQSVLSRLSYLLSPSQSTTLSYLTITLSYLKHLPHCPIFITSLSPLTISPPPLSPIQLVRCHHSSSSSTRHIPLSSLVPTSYIHTLEYMHTLHSHHHTVSYTVSHSFTPRSIEIYTFLRYNMLATWLSFLLCLSSPDSTVVYRVGQHIISVDSSRTLSHSLSIHLLCLPFLYLHNRTYPTLPFLALTPPFPPPPLYYTVLYVFFLFLCADWIFSFLFFSFTLLSFVILSLECP